MARTATTAPAGLLVLIITGLAAAATFAGAETIFIQAEDFECDGVTWIAREQTDRYAPDSRLRHLWGAQGGQGVASREVELPVAGTWRIWVRHTVGRANLPGARGPFLLHIRRGDEVLAEGRFDEQPPDRNPDMVHEYVWSSFDAELPAGRLRLELSKLEPLVCSGWTRYVDAIVLSTDLQYVPSVTDMQPKVWLRVRLGPTPTPPIYIHCFADHFRAPWYNHFSLSRDGFELRVNPKRGAASYLTAGEATPWCDITPVIHEDLGARLELRGAEKYSYDEWLPALDATFDFATAPEDAAIVKSFHRAGPGAGLVVVVPGVLGPQTADQLKRDADYVAEQQALMREFAEPGFGKRPERFPFFVTMSIRPQLHEPWIREAEYQAAARLGFNGSRDQPDELLRSLGFVHGRGHVSAWYMDGNCYLQPQKEKMRERIAQAAAEWEQPPTHVVFMDEPTARPLEHAANCARCREVFRAWLRDELRVPLSDLGVESWDEVVPVTAAEREARPALYYWSQRFRPKSLADFLRVQTGAISELFPGAPPATVNFSDGIVYAANLYAQGTDYFEVFGSRALTMAWSEDWCNIASTYQCCGYNTDVMRAATKYHGQPLGHYIITSYGRTPLDIKLKTYSALGRGARTLNSFSYGPYYTGHEPGWYLNRAAYQAMAELTREIGGAEDLLLQASRQPAPVAILYAVSSDIWASGVNELYGFERMHTWMALTHAQVPVDFLSEEDVARGLLAGYQALYVFGPNLQRTAAGPTSEWVCGGGTLFLGSGAAVADEYNRPARPLDEALGLTRGEPAELHKHTGPGRYLLNLQVKGTVTIPGGEAHLLGTRQSISGGEPMATDETGVVAARLRVGRGTVIACGFMPGLSYIHKALAARDAQGSPTPEPGNPLVWATMGSWANLRPGELSYNPWEYPDAERDFLLEAVREAGVVRPVEVSQPLVEAFLLTGEQGAVVTLANWGLRPIEELTVTIRPGRQVARLESVRSGPLRFRLDGNAVVTKVRLLDTDMLKLYWR